MAHDVLVKGLNSDLYFYFGRPSKPLEAQSGLIGPIASARRKDSFMSFK